MPLDVKAPKPGKAIGGIGGKLTKVPKLVWVVGGGIILAFVIFKGKGGGGGAANGTPSGLDSSVGGGGGGDSGTISSEDITQFLADEAQRNADFQQSILDMIGGVEPPAPGQSGGQLQGNGAGPPIPKPGGTPAKPNPPATTGYKLSLTGSTNFLDNAGKKVVGHGSSGTYLAQLVHIKGKAFYRFKRKNAKGVLQNYYVAANSKTIKVAPSK